MFYLLTMSEFYDNFVSFSLTFLLTPPHNQNTEFISIQTFDVNSWFQTFLKFCGIFFSKFVKFTWYHYVKIKVVNSVNLMNISMKVFPGRLFRETRKIMLNFTVHLPGKKLFSTLFKVFCWTLSVDFVNLILIVLWNEFEWYFQANNREDLSYRKMFIKYYF